MKLLAIDCYHPDDTTAGKKLLNSFIDGAKSAGADIELLQMTGKTILKCKKCTEDPLFKSPNNHCLQHDDMNELYPLFAESDIWLFGISYCISSPSECLLNLMDRLEPIIRINEDDIAKSNKISGKIVLLSTCSFWDIESFKPLLDQFDDLSSLHSKDFAGAMLRPAAVALDKLNGNSNISDIFEAANKAGFSLITEGEIPETFKEQFAKEIVHRKKIDINQFN